MKLFEWEKKNYQLLALLISAVFALSLTACGGSSPESDSPSTEEEPVVTYKVGDTVSTDLVEFTPNNIQFAIALTGSVPFGNDITAADDHYIQPKEYNADDDAKNPYVAPKGSVIVAIEVTTNNLDRTSIDLDEFGGPHDFIAVEYDGKTYAEADSTKNGYYRVKDDHRSVSGTTVSNLYLGNEGPEVHRGFFILPFEPSSLDDHMKVTFNLPNSDGTKTTFVYAV